MANSITSEELDRLLDKKAVVLKRLAAMPGVKPRRGKLTDVSELFHKHHNPVHVCKHTWRSLSESLHLLLQDVLSRQAQGAAGHGMLNKIYKQNLRETEATGGQVSSDASSSRFFLPSEITYAGHSVTPLSLCGDYFSARSRTAHMPYHMIMHLAVPTKVSGSLQDGDQR